METVFRFNVIRDAARSTDEVEPIDLAARTLFQTSAAAIPAGATRRGQLQTLAEGFIASQGFVASVNAVAEYRDLDRISTGVEDLLNSGKVTRQAVSTLVTTELGGSASTFLAAQGLPAKLDAIRDSILAIKLSPKDQRRPLLRLAGLLRANDVIQRLAADSKFPRSREELAAAAHRPLRVPDAVLPGRGTPPAPHAPPPDPGTVLNSIAGKYERLSAAIVELQATPPAGFTVHVDRALPAVLPAAQFRPGKLFEVEQNIRMASLKSTLLAAGSAARGGAGSQAETSGALAAAIVAEGHLGTERLMQEKPGLSVGRGARIALTGRTGYSPILPGASGLRLSAASQAALSAATQQVLSERGLNAASPFVPTLNTLIAERQLLHQKAQRIVQPLAPVTMRRMGGAVIAVRNSVGPTLFGRSPVDLVPLLPPSPSAVPAGAPTTRAEIRPAGIMDLLVVKQQLIRYETADISHIANMLKGEFTDRVKRDRLETETTIMTETERTVATEKSLETTDRFELKRESERALQEETSAKGSLQVKGKYGPSVEFAVSGEAAWQRKTQQSEKNTTEVARQVTQKASERVTERVLRRETLRINRQTEETEQHKFDNTLGTGHISGVYQWITKVYQAQVFNYGPRTVYDLMVPEPGAYLLEVFKANRSAAVVLKEPVEFTLQPIDVQPESYQHYVALYEATDVKPPPEPYTYEAYDFNTGGEDEDQEFTNSTRIRIPDGYDAVHATVGQVVTVWDDWSTDVVIGQQSHRFTAGDSWVWSIDLNGETGSVPFAMVTDKVGDIALALEVVCKATDRATALWQADTHAKLVNAYRARVSEYEAKKADLTSQAPPEVISGSEARNRALMIDELKRACISILTEQHFDQFGAISFASDSTPLINFTENAADGSYVRFFEQAFEWENISWVTYPYFWARKSSWSGNILIEDDDAEFQAFLKAGYVRAQIPVRPGFREALDHFRIFGEVWGGGPLPTISDDLYLPIAQEIAERLDKPGDEVPVGDAWEVRVPTTLIKLRSDDKLPVWEKKPNGSWSEKNPAP